MEESNTAIKQPQGEQAEAELKYSVWKDFKIGLRIVISVPLSQRYRVKCGWGLGINCLASEKPVYPILASW